MRKCILRIFILKYRFLLAGGGGDASIGRGAMRGKRSVPTDIMLVTRPQNLPTKKGKFCF